MNRGWQRTHRETVTTANFCALSMISWETVSRCQNIARLRCTGSKPGTQGPWLVPQCEFVPITLDQVVGGTWM